MVHLFVQSNYWLCFLLKCPHSQLDSLWIIISPTASFSSFNKSLDQYFVIAFDEKEALDFEIVADNSLPVLLILKVSREA
jgi:hypothetical protein